MKIEVKQDGEIFVVELEGRMDTNTSPEFQKEMEAYYSKQGFNMILDFDKLDFVSSAGLRVLLLIQKKSKALSGSLVIKNVKPEIQEVFDMTGFFRYFNHRIRVIKWQQIESRKKSPETSLRLVRVKAFLSY